MHPKKFVKKLLALIEQSSTPDMIGDVLGGLYQAGKLTKKEFLKIFALLQENFATGRRITISNPAKWLQTNDSVTKSTQLGVTLRDGDSLYKRNFERDASLLLD